MAVKSRGASLPVSAPRASTDTTASFPKDDPYYLEMIAKEEVRL